jgi:hypothetical protein
MGKFHMSKKLNDPCLHPREMRSISDEVTKLKPIREQQRPWKCMSIASRMPKLSGILMSWPVTLISFGLGIR